MKILELFGEPISHGGQESFVMNAIAELDKEEYKIDLCTPYYCNNDYYKNTIESYGGNVFAFNLPFSPGGTRKEVHKPLCDFLDVHTYDIIHIHSGSVLFLALCSKIAKNKSINKIIVHSHSSGEHMTFKHQLIQALVTPALKKYPSYYCACSKEAGLWKFPRGIVDEKLIIINNGIDVERYKYNVKMRIKIRNKLNINDDVFLLGHVGRFTDEKNQTYLVDVLEKLQDELNVKLLFIGEGSLLENVLQKAKDKQLDKRIIHIHKTDKVHEYMQAMDCFVFPSKYEGLGMVAIEAQAAGLPVVASKGVPRMINITQRVTFLDYDIDRWINSILEYRKIQRIDTSSEIIRAGFDRKTTSDMIEKIYRG